MIARRIGTVIGAMSLLFFLTSAVQAQLTGAPQRHLMVSLPRTQLRAITSRHIGQDYQLRVWVPESYDTSAARLPVLYLLDGDLLFGTASEMAQYLQWGGLLPPVIVVGIGYGSIHGPENGGTNMRTRDMSVFASQAGYVAGGGVKFLSFLREELIPYIDAQFRTDPADRTLIGFSRGAEFTTFTLLTTPEVFKRYVILDGFQEAWFGLEDALSARTRELPKRVFLSSRFPRSRVAEFADRLRLRGYRGLDVQYADAHPRHFAAAADGITRGLIAVFNKRSVYEALLPLVQTQPMDSVIAEYRRLASNGDSYNVVEDELVQLGNALVNMRRPADAIRIYRLNLERFPSSAPTHSRLGTAQLRVADTTAALASYRRALELNPGDRFTADAVKRLERR